MTKSFWVSPPGNFGPNNWTAGAIAPQVDIVDTPRGIDIFVELAGVKEQDIKITLDQGVLTVFGEKHPHNREEWEQSRYLAERAFGAFRRSINLPHGLDEDAADAHFEDGLLTIHIPHIQDRDAAPGRIISIKSKP
jgi:HSP20 family protein